MSTSALQVNTIDYSSARRNAIEEARNVQRLVVDACANEGSDPPPYILTELAGKGSFGRVYKAFTTTAPKKIVAVKIISIEEGDNFRPGAADTFQDILHEVNTLKLLNESGAKNVNVIIDTLLVGQSIWVITEYCAGGSVATLMRPTKGLAENWIIPILRETAVALHWIHKQAIIHRDIKCANILITDDGGVQLCDFGVAGIIDTQFDKRSTVTGTLQWMAPEFFDSSVSYGVEVDIWAFGSTAFEMAVGLPPNAVPIVDMAEFGSYLKQNPPRLEAEQYSPDLRDLIQQCMVQDPGIRPPIEQIQQHRYIAGTEAKYPTTSLRTLVQSYKIWESQGGSRLSLFSEGGAQAMSESSDPLPEGWNFDTMRFSSDEPDSGAEAAFDVDEFPQQPSRRHAPRHRQRKANMKPLTVPLERVFSPNTISNYDEVARIFYIKDARLPLPDLPLQADIANSNVRESLIDLDAAWGEEITHHVPDEQTIRPIPSGLSGQGRPPTQEWRFPDSWAKRGTHSDHPLENGVEEGPGTIRATPTTAVQQSRPPTREWKFPTMGVSPMETADSPDAAGSAEEVWNLVAEREVIGAIPKTDTRTTNRESVLSLIDLDASLSTDAWHGMYDDCPSTTTSETASASSTPSQGAFYYERQLPYTQATTWDREPSICVPDGVGSHVVPPVLASAEWVFPNQAAVRAANSAPPHSLSHRSPMRSRENTEIDVHSAYGPGRSMQGGGYTKMSAGADIPRPPSTSVLLGSSSPDQVKDELRRLVLSLSEHLQFASDSLHNLPIRRKA